MHKQIKQFMTRRATQSRSLFFVGLSLFAFSGVSTIAIVHAATCSTTSDCQAQISNINGQNEQAKQAIGSLQNQASSYQDAISNFQAQINSLQQQIAASQAQQASLQQQIIDAQNKITEEKKFLGEDIKQMYVDGQLSTIEQLATSKNLSDYVDKEEYSTRVQNSINILIKQIAALQAELQAKKVQVEQLIASQNVQRDQVSAAQAQQAQLLAYNQSQQNDFNSQLAANKSALAQLYAKQAAIIAASFRGGGSGLIYGGTGGYPWPNAVANGQIYTWLLNGSEFDPYGWSYRNCTSYAFWRLAQTSGVILTAGYFPSVSASGGRIKASVTGSDFQKMYRVDHDPNGENVLAVNTNGDYGHIMYVEAVVDGLARVSQYNAAGDGRFSTGTLGQANNIWFVHVR